MKRQMMLLTILALALSPVGVAQDEARVVKTYSIMSGETASIIELVRELIQPNGRVVGDRGGSRLLVLATPEQQVRVAAFLKEWDKPVPNISIEVTVSDVGSREESGIGMEGSGTVVVGPKGPGYDVRISPHVERRSTGTTTSTRQQLLLRSGTEARLFVGQEVGFREWLVEYGRRWGYIEERIRVEQVGAALTVSARVLGDGPQIQVRIVPEISALVEGRQERIALTRAVTEVVAQDGQPLEISGFGENHELYDRYLAGMAKSRSSRNMHMTLLPRIVSP